MATSERRCAECGRPWRTYTYVPCDKPDDCWECDLLSVANPEYDGKHPDDIHDDVDEVVAWRCPHGTMFDLNCRGCGSKVSGWGMGAAGFGELCGCDGK